MNGLAPNAGLLRHAYDVVIVGAGPAGLAAAALAGGGGLSTLLVDENPSAGGQVYRAVSTTPVGDRSVLGTDYAKGAALVSAMQAAGVDYVAGGIVWYLDREMVVGISINGAARLIKAKRVILATGALERPFPIPGWTLPGMMTIGAAQTMLKASGLLPVGRVVLAGQGPLLWLYAAQMLRAGGSIEAILDTTPRANWAKALPHVGGFLVSPYFRKGLALMREVKAKTSIIRNVSALAAQGNGRLETLTFTANGRRSELALDGLFLHQGVVPNVNLAMAAGVEHRWDGTQLCFSPVLDAYGRTSIPGISVVGDGAGIGGAEAAAERGRLSALVVVKELAPATKGLPDEHGVKASLAQAMRGRAFLDRLFRPADQFRIPGDADTIVCRCEEVTAGQIRASIAVGAAGPNQLKAYRRCGMGPCQGRLCGLTVTELMAEARGLTPQEIGYYRLRSPVKPITVREMASIPVDDADIDAVVR